MEYFVIVAENTHDKWAYYKKCYFFKQTLIIKKDHMVNAVFPNTKLLTLSKPAKILFKSDR